MQLPDKMPHLADLYYQENLNLQGRVLKREAVRAIVWREDKLLMIHSGVGGDYRVPGGGIKPGEEHLDALRRELREESGAVLLEVEEAYGRMYDYASPRETDYDLYQMISYYYVCRIEPVLTFRREQMDERERER